jgi:hypothetical protein
VRLPCSGVAWRVGVAVSTVCSCFLGLATSEHGPAPGDSGNVLPSRGMQAGMRRGDSFFLIDRDFCLRQGDRGPMWPPRSNARASGPQWLRNDVKRSGNRFGRWFVRPFRQLNARSLDQVGVQPRGGPVR